MQGHVMEKTCWTAGWQCGKKLNHLLGSHGHAAGIGYLLGAALIEASEKTGLNHEFPSGVPGTRFDLDI